MLFRFLKASAYLRVFVHVYMHACLLPCVFVCLYASLRVCLYARMCVRAPACMRVCVRGRLPVCERVCVPVCVRVCVPVCMCPRGCLPARSPTCLFLGLIEQNRCLLGMFAQACVFLFHQYPDYKERQPVATTISRLQSSVLLRPKGIDQTRSLKFFPEIPPTSSASHPPTQAWS